MLFRSGIEARPWLIDQWLADLFLYSGYSAGGWPLLYALLLVAYLLTYFFVLYRGAVELTGLRILSCLAAVYAFKIGQIHFILRPVLFSFLFFSIVYVQIYSLYYALTKEGDRQVFARRYRRALILLPLDRLIGVTLDALGRPAVNAAKVTVMAVVNLVGNLVVLSLVDAVWPVLAVTAVNLAAGILYGGYHLRIALRQPAPEMAWTPSTP